MVVDGDSIVWLGTEDAVDVHAGPNDDVVDLDGAFVTPAFVDAHVHCTGAGLSITGVNLAGVRSGLDLLEAVATAAVQPGRVVLGGGWDESRWVYADDVPDAARISRAAGGKTVYLARVDAHSALVSADLLADDLSSLTGFSPDGWLRRDAHDRARERAQALLGDRERERAQRAALASAAALGIACVHEMAGPSISSADDLRELLALTASAQWSGPAVIGYWGELNGIETALELGAAGAGGDLFCDGALGSHTAALREPYADRPATHPGVRFEVQEIGAHVAACVQAGLQAGFHAIGDAAVDVVLAGVDDAARRLGAARVRAGRHRIEHAEMIGDVARFADAALIASMQPAFDAAWGGSQGMYASRLGVSRAAGLNDFAALAGAGVTLAFGSDAPVTPLNPWAAVRAASAHTRPASSISPRAAFTAHTRGGWRAARIDDGSGTLAVGHPATYAVWNAGELAVDAPDERVARWSTDARAGVAGLPDLAAGRELPICRATVLRGRTIFDATAADPIV